MRRVRVQAVDGNRVLADGKWLTCIGNRTVCPREWIWTDGLCVYGHEFAGGSVPVIGGGGERCIPFYSGSAHYIYRKGEVRELCVDRRRGGLLYSKAHMAHFLKYPHPQEHSQLLDADMDAAGNVFTLTGVDWRDDGKDMAQTVNSHGFVRVRKNGEEIASFDLCPYYERWKLSRRASVVTGGGHIDCDGRWGLYAEIDSTTAPSGVTRPGDESISVMYYIDPTGARELFHAFGRNNENGFLRKTENHAGAGDMKFPIHDGYYYMWENCEPISPNSMYLPQRAIMTIYSPSGGPVVTGCFTIGTRFTILRVGEGVYLLGVHKADMCTYGYFTVGWDEIPWEQPSEWASAEAVENGVYLCKEGAMESLRSDCETFRFRRVRDVRIWEKTLQRLL